MKVYNLWETITITVLAATLIGASGILYVLERHFSAPLRDYTNINNGPLELILYLVVVTIDFSAVYLVSERIWKFRNWAKSVEIVLPEKINWMPIKFRKI